MKLVLAVLLNAGLLALLLPWLIRQWHWAGAGWWRTIFAVGLALRVVVGVARSWVPKLDAQFMTYLSTQVTARLWSGPAEAASLLFGSVNVFRITHADGTGYDAVYQGLSNTWYLIKILALLNLASLETSWLNGLYLSLFAFVGCWQLVRKLAQVLPHTLPGAGVVAFLLWPSVWFWTTGISKEAALLGSGAWLTAQVLDLLYGDVAGRRQGWHWLGWGLLTAGLAYFHFKMRYFFAVPLLGVLAGVALGYWLQQLGLARYRWVQAGVMAAVLGLGIWLAPQLSTGFSANKFTNQVIKVYTFEVEHSVGKPHFEYPDLRPTLESMMAHAPLAVANVLTRPWLGESRQPTYIAAGLENAAILSLLVLAVVALARGRGGHLPFALGLGLVVFCLILAFLMGLTTPNLGSLNRYRSELVPFLLFLLLQNDYAAALLRRVGLAGPSRS
ncbi:hypothetical protein [Hymenobacter arizonensis]|uniref:Glycosyltransferase RgtA/B/C/D-like domain-containing protein n=1 Tax=Hymenobacter arizonensis TaxID=1227077 RepID=A0A1I5TEG1_HYMAR|nr:hypothetical protein [Hymenobacter arizonensis]SFP81077.1 hypothetical protein SAMN04515668_0427 [Hymenobacter arizonensis]